jgi:hypothetical protein
MNADGRGYRNGPPARRPPPGMTVMPAFSRRGTERPRVGFWLGLLLLFVPIFAPLLFFKPYSWFARIGWCGWLGFIVFVKLSGLSEPVIDLSQLTQQVKIREEQPAAPAPPAASGLKGTFVQPPGATSAPPTLDVYLRELGGGVLGRRIADWHVDGDAIAIRFQETDWFLPSEARIAEESIGAALSLFYGRDFQRVTLDFDVHGKPLRVALTRAEFRDFFGYDDAQIRAILADPKRQQGSVFHAENMPKGLRARFIKQFAHYQ